MQPMDLPKITIATVCFNAEHTIEKTIKSVVAQTYPNIEYIVIDGQSKDNTLTIVDQYKEHVDKVISEKDRNNYDAMNKAMKHATGDYIWFLHAGDIAMAPDTLETIMQEHNDEDFIYGHVQVLDEEGNEHPWHKTIPKPEDLTWKTLRNGMIICHQAMLVHRRVWVDYDMTYPLVGDLDWTIRLMKQVKSVRYSNTVFCSFLTGGISAQTRKKSLKERFVILKKHFGLIPTLWEHVRIVFLALKRGSIGAN
jgi:glycosyltransferase involved in cell wall biosynthesis